MRDFDPMDPNMPRTTHEPPLERDPMIREDDSSTGMTMLGIIAAIAIAIGAGVYFWSTSDHAQVASNNTPAVTTPASPPAKSTPPAPATPDAGKTDNR